MRMTDFVVRDAIIANVTASSKETVIREIVDSLRRAGQFKDDQVEDVVRAIKKREDLGSTGIGRGVAIPHTKHACVERLLGTIAVSKNGVPFDSLDGEPVHVLVMLISPQDRPGEHLRALENVSKCLRNDDFVRALRAAETKEAIWALLERGTDQHPT